MLKKDIDSINIIIKECIYELDTVDMTDEYKASIIRLGIIEKAILKVIDIYDKNTVSKSSTLSFLKSMFN